MCGLCQFFSPPVSRCLHGTRELSLIAKEPRDITMNKRDITMNTLFRSSKSYHCICPLSRLSDNGVHLALHNTTWQRSIVFSHYTSIGTFTEYKVWHVGMQLTGALGDQLNCLHDSTTSPRYRFSAFWLRSKCSICSYQLNIWYVAPIATSILNWFLVWGEMHGACSALATGRPGLAVLPGMAHS